MPTQGSDLPRTTRRIGELCRRLLTDTEGGTSTARATEVLRLYDTLDAAGRVSFFQLLLRDFSPSPDDVGHAADAYRLDPSPENLHRLQQVVEPPRQELFRRFNMATGGTHALVNMRAEVLKEVEAYPELKPIASDLGQLLASWFNSGFVTLQRIDWRSPAVILEKLIAYEAVHQIQGWHDLRRRLEADRRCYGFFHAGLPNEPLIFIEVALTRGMSDSIQPLIDPDAPLGDFAAADHAIFYSITNCQPGLRGVPLGSSLIKQVVEDLRKSLPRVKAFATLSPIPAFRKWLKKEVERTEPVIVDGHNELLVNDEESRRVLELLEQPDPADYEWAPDLKQRLLSLCAWYLVNAKRDAEPLDPVARFHLRNGARVERINWMADPSAGGIRQSGGLMANYVYELNELEKNNETYTRSGEVVASGRVEKLARQLIRSRNHNWLARRFS